MGKKQKKGTSGAVTNFVSRNVALKKLKISLADFRRLCILKGIFPREPKSLKKIQRGSSAPKTYYWTKDIQFLAHEPLLKKFREFKAFAKRLQKAKAKGEYSLIGRIKNNKPVYALDHLIRERYPTFIDALRDLDDALTMVSLFSTLSRSCKVYTETAERCSRLLAEFQQFCILTHSLRKVFLSIKGIYYQVEVQGQTVTWIAPHHFSHRLPDEVDFRVMTTFLEFYETLLGFVNFKLYHDENMVYPPVINHKLEVEGAGLSSLVVKPLSTTETRAIVSKTASADKKTKGEVTDSKERIKTLASKLSTLKDEEPDVEQTEVIAPVAPETDSNELDEFPINTAEGESSAGVKVTELNRELNICKKLFSGCVFFLGREVPRGSLEFVIKSFGGKLGWEDGAGSPFGEDSEHITHQIMDRPSQKHQYLGRTYVQPQWVYDCINFRRILPVDKYVPGADLPPHFSPFMAEQEGDYVPKELLEMRGELPPQPKAEEEEEEEEEAVEDDDEPEGDDGVRLDNDLKEEDEEGEEPEEEEEEEEPVDSDDEEAIYQRELQAEATGIPFSKFAEKKNQPKKNAPLKPKASELKKKEEEKEEKELSKIMMKKKDKRLYEKILASKNRKKHYAERMEKKRQRVEESAKEAQGAKKRRVK